jgi:hypothetical protein
VCGLFGFDFKVKDKNDLLKFADFIQIELTETLGSFYENLNDGYIGSGINAVSKLVDRNEDLIDKAGDVAGSVVGVGKNTFNLFKDIVNKDDNPWDYIKTGIEGYSRIRYCTNFVGWTKYGV